MQAKNPAAAGCLDGHILRQGSGVAPDSDETVLRSRARPKTTGNCRPASGDASVRRLPKSFCLLIGYRVLESDPAAEIVFFNPLVIVSVGTLGWMVTCRQGPAMLAERSASFASKQGRTGWFAGRPDCLQH
jgi:hypothetical protein